MSKLEKKINKDEQKKLKIVEKYTPQQLDQLIKILSQNKKQSINEIV